ncbi:hypothetical protein ACNKHR_22530 [Shigella flexneri]
MSRCITTGKLCVSQSKRTVCVTPRFSCSDAVQTSSQISNATNGIQPPRGYVSIKASKDGISRQVVPDYEHLHDPTSCCGKCRVTMVICIGGYHAEFINESISANTNYDPSRFPHEKCRCSSC